MSETHSGQMSAPPPEPFVDLTELEQQLARLWHPDSVGLSAHTSVLNLIIFANDPAAHERARTATEHLAESHSCRVIIFNVAQPGDERPPGADIYAACRLDQNHPHGPCIERVEVPLQRSMLREVPVLTRSLVVPELPTFLWWMGPPSFHDDVAVQVLRSGNQFIMDSLSFSETTDLTTFHSTRARLPAHIACADLNWERLLPWRTLTAQFFDFRQVQWALSYVREVEIEAGKLATGILPAQALLFACWMAHCLGWTTFEVRRTRHDRWYVGARDRHGKHVRIMIRTRRVDEQHAGHMLSLSIAARDDEGRSSALSLTRTQGSPIIRMHAKSGLETTLHHAIHHPLLSEEVLLAQALESPEHDYVFEETLRHASSVVELLERRDTA